MDKRAGLGTMEETKASALHVNKRIYTIGVYSKVMSVLGFYMWVYLTVLKLHFLTYQ